MEGYLSVLSSQGVDPSQQGWPGCDVFSFHALQVLMAMFLLRSLSHWILQVWTLSSWILGDFFRAQGKLSVIVHRVADARKFINEGIDLLQ